VSTPAGKRKMRLDALVAGRGQADSREQARRLIMAGLVTVEGARMDKPGTLVPGDASVEVAMRPRFVSRGGDKLDAALERFAFGNMTGLVCADVGASTGGFTDCLLQRGAAKVYALDVGHGLIAWTLRNNPRVVVMEKTNARYVEQLPERVDLVTIDASFISLRLLLPVVRRWLDLRSPISDPSVLHNVEIRGRSLGIVALIKPQFEAGRKDVGKGGVVKDPAVHRRVLEEILEFASGQGLAVRGLIPSPLVGPKGNVEFLAWFGVGDQAIDRDTRIEAALREVAAR